MGETARRAILLVCFVFSWAFAAPARAAETVVLIAASNLTYRLEKDGNKFRWVQTESGDLDGQEFARPAGRLRTPVGFTEIGENRHGRPAVNFRPDHSSGKQYPLPKLPEGDVYEEAMQDGAGNFYVRVMGTNSFTFIPAGAQFMLKPDDMDIVGNLTHIVPNPYGEGLFGIMGDGEIITLMLPPTRLGEGFRQINWGAKDFLDAPADKLVIGDVDGQPVLVALGQTGRTGVFEINGQVIQELIIARLTHPQGAPVGKMMKLVSTYQSQAGTRIESARSFLDRAEPRPAARRPTSTALVPVGKPKPKPVFEGVRIDESNKAFFRAIRRNLSDIWALDGYHNINTKLYERPDEVQRAFDVLVRTSGNHPVILGEIGTGKTVVGDLIARALRDRKFGAGPRFEEVLGNAVVIETTPALIEGAGSFSSFFSQLRAVEETSKKRIVVILNRMWEMTGSQMATLKSILARDPRFLVVGLTLPSHFSKLGKNDPEISRIFEGITLPALTDEQTISLLKESVVPGLQITYRSKTHQLRIDDGALLVAVQRARQLYPDLGFPEGPRKLLEAMCVLAHREAGDNGEPVLDVALARRYTKQQLNLPFDPYDTEELERVVAKHRKDLKDEIFEQDRIIDWLVDTYRDIVRPTAQVRHRSVLLIGPTGSGKSYVMMRAFTRFFGADRVKEFDCTKYLEKESLTTLLGSWPGYVNADRMGELPEFLSGKGKHLNGIIFNEWEKASPELANAIMTLLLDGYITDSFGVRYYAGTSIIALTSNKGDETFFPRDGSLTWEEQVRRAESATPEDVKRVFRQPDPNNRYDMSKVHNAANMRRIDHAFFMMPPSPTAVLRILRDLTLRDAKAAKGINIEVDPRLLLHLVMKRYRPEDGPTGVQKLLISTIDAAYAHYARAIEAAPAGQKPTLHIHWTPGEGPTAPRVSASLGADGANAVTIDVEYTHADVIPLEDPVKRAHVEALPGKLRAGVKGQDRAVEASAEAIANQRYFRPDPKRPGVLVFLGPTGVGKSELAEHIAEVEFGSRARCRSISVGGVKDMGDIDNIFGTPRGRWGSESMAEFEAFLSRYEKEGGVIHLEEIGNVAPNNPAVRSSFFSILYSILLGKWTNALGKTYDTSKFIFVFSSNEGQELFYNSPSDDLRMSTYERYRKIEYLRGLLLRAGWPQALIGRLQGNLILFAPLIEAIRREIAQKFIDNELTALRKWYPIEIENLADVYAEVAALFFSHETGARGMQDFAEQQQFPTGLRKVIQPIFTKHGEGARAILARSKVKIMFQDNWRGLTFFIGPRPEERKVTMHVELVDPQTGETWKSEQDITDAVVQRRLPSRRSLLRTAYHEAGHVIANDPRRTGVKMEHVTIIGQGNYGGYARWGELAPTGPMSRIEALAKLSMFLAGRTAEELAGFDDTGGWSADLEMARELATLCVARYGLTERALGLPLKDGKVNLDSKEVSEEVGKLMREAKAEAVRRLTAEWATVRAMTWRLFVEQALDEAAINQILRDTGTAEYRTQLAQAIAAGKQPAHHGTPRADNCARALVTANALAPATPAAPEAGNAPK